MKPLLRSAILGGVLVAGATSVFAASGSYVDQWYRAKFGRGSPMEEARLRAEQANTAYREEATPKAVVPANTWFEDFWRAKHGRSSPIEEARLKAVGESTAYREEVRPKAAIPNTWRDDFWKAKYGRNFPNK